MRTLLVMIGIIIVTIIVANVIILNLLGIPFSSIPFKSLLALDGAFALFFTLLFVLIGRKV